MDTSSIDHIAEELLNSTFVDPLADVTNENMEGNSKEIVGHFGKLDGKENLYPVTQVPVKNKNERKRKGAPQKDAETMSPKKKQKIPERKLHDTRDEKEMVPVKPAARKVQTTMVKNAPTKAKVPKTVKTIEKVQKEGHPPVKEMVLKAMEYFRRERKGVSLQLVKKYLKQEYNYENSRFVTKTMRFLLTSGSVTKASGIGLQGKFKLPVMEHKPKAKAKTSTKAAVKQKSTKAKSAPAKSVAETNGESLVVAKARKAPTVRTSSKNDTKLEKSAKASRAKGGKTFGKGPTAKTQKKATGSKIKESTAAK